MTPVSGSGFKDVFTHTAEENRASDTSTAGMSEQDRVSDSRTSSQAAGKKYRKIVPGKLHSPLMKYLKGEGPRSFVPLSAEFHVESVENESEKTPELVAMLYRQAAFGFKVGNASKFTANCAEGYTESTLGKWQSNLIVWNQFDPHNLMGLSVVQRMRIDPMSEGIVANLIRLRREEEAIYKHYSVEKNTVYRECNRDSIAKIREKIWKKIRKDALGENPNQVREALFTAREGMAKLSSRCKTHVVSRVSSVLPGHSIVAATKYAVVTPLFLVAYSAHRAVKMTSDHFSRMGSPS